MRKIDYSAFQIESPSLSRSLPFRSSLSVGRRFDHVRKREREWIFFGLKHRQQATSRGESEGEGRAEKRLALLVLWVLLLLLLLFVFRSYCAPLLCVPSSFRYCCVDTASAADVRGMLPIMMMMLLLGLLLAFVVVVVGGGRRNGTMYVVCVCVLIGLS